MRDTLDQRRLFEIRSLLAADLRTSGATTTAEVEQAAAESLLSLMGEPQIVVVEQDTSRHRSFTVRIEGPTLIDGILIRL